MSKLKQREVITTEMLLNLGFKRLNDDDLDFWHPWLDPKNIYLSYFNDSYHFMLRPNTYQGIGQMKILIELEIGFKFIAGRELYDYLIDN